MAKSSSVQRRAPVRRSSTMPFTQTSSAAITVRWILGFEQRYPGEASTRLLEVLLEAGQTLPEQVGSSFQGDLGPLGPKQHQEGEGGRKLGELVSWRRYQVDQPGVSGLPAGVGQLVDGPLRIAGVAVGLVHGDQAGVVQPLDGLVQVGACGRR